MTKHLWAVALALAGTPAAAAEAERTFEGTWVNRRYNTNGTMTCVAKPGDNGVWSATFSGKFQGDPFKYDVTFKAKPGRGQSDLSGSAEIRNHKYQWTGTLKGDTLTGRYRSNSGYFGEFVLKEKK